LADAAVRIAGKRLVGAKAKAKTLAAPEMTGIAVIFYRVNDNSADDPAVEVERYPIAPPFGGSVTVKRTFAIVLVILSVTAMTLMASRTVAEPISGADFPSHSSMTPQRQELNEALARFKAGDYESALNQLEEIAKKNTDVPPAQVIMATLFFQAKMPEEAIKALEKAVLDVPDDPEAYLLLARVAAKENDLDKTKTLCQKARQLVSSFNRSEKRKALLQPMIYGSLAQVAEARKDWAEAQVVMESWLKLEPNNIKLMRRLAHALFQQKNVEGALEKYREAAKIDTQTAAPEALLSMLFHKAGDLENAKKWITVAVAEDPRNLQTRLAAAQWALNTVQLDEARKHAIAATRISPKSAIAKELQGIIALFDKSFEAAEFFFEAILKRSPTNARVRNNLALALIEQEDESKRQRALEYAEANVEEYPAMAQFASTLGWVFYRLGRLDDAEKALRPAASIAESDLDTAYFIARVSVDRGRKAEARRLLEAAAGSASPAIFRKEAEELLKKLKN